MAPGARGAAPAPASTPAPSRALRASSADLPVLTTLTTAAPPVPADAVAGARAAKPARAGTAAPAFNPDSETAGVVVDDASAPAVAAAAPVKGIGQEIHHAHPETTPAKPLGRIGPYVLTDVISHDGLGRVFKARDSSEAADVRITLLDLDTNARDRDGVVQQLQKAVLAAASLQHPGLARIVDAGVVGEGVYICNAWTSGRTLAQALHAGWQPTARVAAQMVCSLARALAFAHAAGVMHGGLNPSNVTLDEDDNPVVLGLGYACTAHASDMPSLDPLVTGAAPYLAPEQLQGGAVDVRTDIHALGVLLYELLAGRRAYPGQTVPEVARALMSHDPAPPHWLRFDVPERLSAIAMQALQRNPAARYAQASEVVAALDAWLHESVQEDEAARQALVQDESSDQAEGAAGSNLRRKGLWATAALLLAATAVVAFSWVERQGSPQAIAPEPVAGTAVESPSTPTPTPTPTTAPAAATTPAQTQSNTVPQCQVMAWRQTLQWRRPWQRRYQLRRPVLWLWLRRQSQNPKPLTAFQPPRSALRRRRAHPAALQPSPPPVAAAPTPAEAPLPGCACPPWPLTGRHRPGQRPASSPPKLPLPRHATNPAAPMPALRRLAQPLRWAPCSWLSALGLCGRGGQAGRRVATAEQAHPA